MDGSDIGVLNHNFNLLRGILYFFSKFLFLMCD